MHEAVRWTRLHNNRAFPTLHIGSGLTLPVPTLPGAVGLATVAMSENENACRGEQEFVHRSPTTSRNLKDWKKRQ